MSKKDMLVITNDRGEIIAAQVQDNRAGAVASRIRPTEDNHTLYEMTGVPAEIHRTEHPEEFHRRITDHLNSQGAQVRAISVEELRSAGVQRR